MPHYVHQLVSVCSKQSSKSESDSKVKLFVLQAWFIGWIVSFLCRRCKKQRVSGFFFCFVLFLVTLQSCDLLTSLWKSIVDILSLFINYSILLHPRLCLQGKKTGGVHVIKCVLFHIVVLLLTARKFRPLVIHCFAFTLFETGQGSL